MAEDKDGPVRMALMERRLTVVEESVEAVHRKHNAHMAEIPQFRREIRDDARKNETAIKALADMYETDKPRRVEASAALLRIETYITREKTIDELNKKHITLAATIIGSAITLFAGALLFVGDVIAKFWKGG